MSETTLSPLIDWDKVNYQARVADTMRHKGLTITSSAVHFMIEAVENKLVTRIVVFGEKSQRIVDALLDFTPDELRTALNLFRRKDVPNPKKYVREGDRLVILYKPPEKEVEQYYFVLSEEISRIVGRYLDHHFPRQ